MPSNHLILCHLLLLLPSIFPRIRVLSSESALHIMWAKYLSFNFSISLSNEHSGLISFRMDWLDLLAVQRTLKSLLQYHMYFAWCTLYKLNKQGDNTQPWCTPFSIWNQSVVPFPVLTVASWPAYRFLRRQVRWSGIPISWRIFHSLLWSTQSKVVAQSIKQMFFWNSLAFMMIQQMLAIWSLVPLLFLNPAWTSRSSRFTVEPVEAWLGEFWVLLC